MINRLAANAKFTEDEIWVYISDSAKVDSLAIAYELQLAHWASMFGKLRTVIKSKGMQLTIPASLAMNNQPKKWELYLPKSLQVSTLRPGTEIGYL